VKLAALGAGFFPSTLAGRVLFIIFAGLIVAHLAAFALFEMERTQAAERYAAADAAARIAEYARLPTEFAIAPSRSAPRARIRWQVVSALENPPQGESRPSLAFEAELRRLLKQSLGGDPVAWMSMREVKEGAGTEPAGSRKFVTVALNLPDGRFAVAESMLFEPSLRIPAEAWLSIGLLFVLTANFSIWAVNLATKPVRLLAGAAERLSRNIDEPPLSEEGADEIRSAARSFNRMQDRLRRHVNSRAIAFAAMSHDLRTPLTRMRLRLESLDEAARHKLEGDLDEIEALATSALDATRGLAIDEPLTRVDLDALAARLRDDFAQMGRELRVEGNAAPIDARPLLLRRALVNAVDNAFKYASQVTFQLEDSASEVRLNVLDRGPGIAPEELEKVLYPFYRVESSRNRETGGVGLGLAIAKDIAEGHGGTLEVANRPEGGLRVTFVLPR
jgi:signal transduction histidine kinase